MKAYTIPVEDFGRDHWSTFGYIECCCVDNEGKPCHDRMRVNDARHPEYRDKYQMSHSIAWKDDYSTRLRGHTEEVPRRATGHDDWDCVADFAAEGLLEIKGTKLRPCFKLTKKGMKVAAALRAHKANGGMFATFKGLPARQTRKVLK